jgi:uracil-DNA glycosylase family 4
MIGKLVHGEGNVNARVMLIGEAPGRMESGLGRPFVGLSGADLNRYLLMLCGLRREDVWVTNLVKYRTDEDNSDPTAEDIARDEGMLWQEIEAIKPEVIVTVGRVSTEYFLGPINMEFVHALPLKSPKYPNGIILATYHPAAALHQADKFSKLVYNSFKRLGMYLRGELDWSLSQIPINYSEINEAYVPIAEEVAIDTEGIPKKPWGLSFAFDPGTSYVLKEGGKWGVTAARYILHNALWDLPVLRSMGITLPYDRIDDTMILAHILCVEPRKLKALAYREAGLEMENYKDVIKEADHQIAQNYLQKAASYLCADCKGQGIIQVPYKRQPKTGPPKFRKENCGSCKGDKTSWGQAAAQLVFEDDFTARIYQPQSIGKRLHNLLGRDANLRKGWQDLGQEVREPVEAVLGRMPDATLDDVVPRERAVSYSAADADATLRVYHKLRPRVAQMGLETAYEIDRNCIPIIDRMHQNGILINKDYFADLTRKFTKEQYEISQQIHDEVGVYFNPASPVQIKKELAKLGLRDLESSDERTLRLAKLTYNDPKLSRLIDLSLDYRELNKLKSTYTEPLPRQTDEYSRIHTTFILSAYENEGRDEYAEGPSTSRLSSRNPNLQNIPTATPRGDSIRVGFIAKPGCKLLSVDLSQIELRVGAHLAYEQNMIDAFCSGKDLHTYTAAKMFNVPYDLVDKKTQRYPAKTINFGIFYGMSEYRLQSELALEGLVISLEDARGFIAAWFDAYPGIKPYMHRVQAEARQNSFVRTMFGHIRYLPNVHSKDDRIREEALRQAGNHPVQGSSGEILKIAMANIQYKVYPELNLMGYFEPLLTIHDEIIFEVEDSISDLASAMVTFEMEHAVKLSVPLLSSYKIGNNWQELK